MTTKLTHAFLCCLFALQCSAPQAAAQTDSENPDAPKSAYIKVVNACEVRLPEPWRAGLDLSFKDNTLAADIRPGERCSYRKITFTGKDRVDFRMTQSKNEATSIPATFDKGCFYTIVITGPVTESGAKVSAIIRKDFPENPANVRKGLAHVSVINAIASFPVSAVAGKATVSPPASGQADIFLDAGEQPFDLKFKDHKGRDQILRNSLIVAPDRSYSAVILNSTEGGNRPMIFKSCETEEMQDAVEQEKTAEEDKKKSAGASTQ